MSSVGSTACMTAAGGPTHERRRAGRRRFSRTGSPPGIRRWWMGSAASWRATAPPGATCWGWSFSGPGPTSCRDFYETGSFSFMHANYDPYLPMDRQPATRLRWESVEPGRQSHRLAPARGTVAPQLPFAGHDHARGRASEKKIRAKAIAPVRIFPKSLRKCSRGGV